MHSPSSWHAARPIPLTRDLVLIGGGHTHALVLRAWGMTRLAGARLTLINPAPTAPYTGMLPGHVAGHYPRAALEIDLVRLARFAGARLVLGTAEHIDRDAKRVLVPGRPPIRYDVVSIDIGITSAMPQIPGFAAHGVAAKPLGPFARRWAAFCSAVAAGKTRPEVAVIGAGVAGVELALAMHHRLTPLGQVPKITLIEAAAALPELSGDTRAVLFERLRRADIRLIEREALAEVTAEGVLTDAGKMVAAALTVGAAGARPHGWLTALGLDHAAGFITVDQTLRSVSDPAIYAVGDCAHLGFAPRPKAGVFAVRAAPVLGHNLRAELVGGTRRRFRPQRDYLKLISLGGKDAVADRSGLTLTGPALWRWKDRIDRAFMAKLADLPAMARAPLPPNRARGVAEAMGPQPPCAGCGSKVGSDALRSALARLPHAERPDVLSHLGDDAAILRTGGATQVLTTDHLRAFTDDPVTFARIASIHALGDIWAMGARPQAATASVILPHMSAGLAEATLTEVLDVAADVFRASGAELVGGHTSFGAELTLGFSVTGLAERGTLTQGGALPGDALILTRPIGAGTLLAGEMRLKAQGEDIAAMLRVMAEPQGDAAEILAKGGARAMTDVTGFGLAGHLMALCEASRVGARLELDTIPIYSGAEALAASGLRSTLWPENHAAVAGRVAGPLDRPRAVLLFDPQTAGGFLAAVPSTAAKTSVKALCAQGHDAALIGTVTEESQTIVIT
ncbi:MAG: selenide, water dikinase SelD [Pseudomonadota bacterium]